MSEIARIVDQLKRIHESDAWHGPALREVLAGVSAEQAAARPMSGRHSIWELVLHIAAWEDVFLRRLDGHDLDEPEQGDFPPVGDPSQENWEQALAWMDSVHEQLIEKVSSLSESGLQETVVGKDYSVRFMLAGIVQHSVYHAGQIALLN